MNRKLLCGLCLCLATARAGLAPENLAVMVVADSWSSLTIANHYADLRDIPGHNIVRVAYNRQTDADNIDAFRAFILKPALEELHRRGLNRQIRCLAWSADFPTKISLERDLKDMPHRPKIVTSAGSINGLSYLYQMVVHTNLSYVGMRANLLYAAPEAKFVKGNEGESDSAYRKRIKVAKRTMDAATAHQPGLGFVDEPYLPSTVLAVTSGEGFPVATWVDWFKRSKGADGSRPKGTVYLQRTKDVRSRTREWAFHPLVHQLDRRGIAAEIASGPVPKRKDDVAGAVLGQAKIDWPGSGSRMLPGAIVENLTSFGGGIARPGRSQTSLIHFINAGAAGSAGTVTEPYAIQAKFPSPFIQAHYADGLTLAEAFYRSIHAPYQLLIIGDPLCAPWAEKVGVTLEGLSANALITGDLSVSCKTANAKSLAYAEWYLDGRYLGTSAPNTVFPVRMEGHSGEHRLVMMPVRPNRAVALNSVAVPFHYARKNDLEIDVPASAHYGEDIQVEVPGAERLEVFHFGTSMGISSNRTLRFSSREVGMGPVRLRILARLADGRRLQWSPRIQILPPEVIPPLDKAPTDMEPGISCLAGDRISRVVQSIKGVVLNEDGGLLAEESGAFEGYLKIPKAGLYQFQVTGQAGVELFINDRSVLPRSAARRQMLPVSLAEGVYGFRLEVVSPKPRASVTVAFGADGTALLGPEFLRFAP